MWSAWEVTGALLLLAAATGFALRLARRAPYALVGWLWYLAALVPLIGLIQSGDQAIADRHLYVPALGVFALVVFGAADLARRAPRGFPILAACALLVAVAGTLRTRTQLETWRHTLALFEHAVAVTEGNWLALNNLAWLRATCQEAAVRDGERAVQLALEACEITRFGEPELLDTLAAAYAEAGRFSEAVATARRAVTTAEQAGRTGAARVYRSRLALLEAEEPIRTSQGCP